jgi:hypothetical protein
MTNVYAQQPEWHSAGWHDLAQERSEGHYRSEDGTSAYHSTLIGDKSAGRANGTARTAAFQQAQKLHGNKAVQRFVLHSNAAALRSIAVQREEYDGMLREEEFGPTRNNLEQATQEREERENVDAVTGGPKSTVPEPKAAGEGADDRQHQGIDTVTGAGMPKNDAQYEGLAQERDLTIRAQVEAAQARWMPPANNPAAMSPREQWEAGLWR